MGVSQDTGGGHEREKEMHLVREPANRHLLDPSLDTKLEQ